MPDGATVRKPQDTFIICIRFGLGPSAPLPPSPPLSCSQASLLSSRPLHSTPRLSLLSCRLVFRCRDRRLCLCGRESLVFGGRNRRLQQIRLCGLIAWYFAVGTDASSSRRRRSPSSRSASSCARGTDACVLAGLIEGRDSFFIHS